MMPFYHPMGAFFWPLLLIGFFFLMAYLLQWLWNLTLPAVFNFKALNYWQSFRLLVIGGVILVSVWIIAGVLFLFFSVVFRVPFSGPIW